MFSKVYQPYFYIRRRSSSCDCNKEKKILNVKEGTYDSIPKTTTEPPPSIESGTVDRYDNGERLTLRETSATTESHHHQFTESSPGVRYFIHSMIKLNTRE